MEYTEMEIDILVDDLVGDRVELRNYINESIELEERTRSIEKQNKRYQELIKSIADFMEIDAIACLSYKDRLDGIHGELLRHLEEDSE